MSKPIISLTTIPNRLPHIGPCIESLKAQGLRVYVWIQERTERTGAVFDGQFPDFLAGTTATVVAERGPITKLISALPLADVILCADDDTYYGEGWADGLLDYHAKLPGCALGYRGRQFQGRHYNDSRVIAGPQSETPVDILTGNWGVLYCADWFDDSIYEEWKAWPLGDDLVIHAHLRRRGIGRIVIPKRCELRALPSVYQIDELWQINRTRNDEGLEAAGWWA